MKRFVLPSIILLLVSISPSYALEIPERPNSYVHDQASMLSAETRDRLNTALETFENITTNQVVVATFPSLDGGSLEDYSIKLAEAWKPGQKGRDNGVIFLIIRDDRLMRIEVGYGLEGALPDALAGQIIQYEVAPHFKKGNYDEGVLAAATAIMKAIEGEYRGKRSPYGTGTAGEDLKGLLKFLWTAIVILFWVDLFRYFVYWNGHRTYKHRYSALEWWFRFSILLIFASLPFRVGLYPYTGGRGKYYGSRKGFETGMFPGGGWSSGGGFSGGGGGFGGGGASGRW
ncbi:MAG: TPM domain-containing protein [Candidatus Omnitrophica bacterium]|nr:TPM domain-containing protein [Candidatus Omnitrophota bacterium]